jgi:hypothetical protein
MSALDPAFRPSHTTHVTSTYTSERAKAAPKIDLSSETAIRARDKALRKAGREFKSKNRDEGFKQKVFWVVLVTLTVGDYLYLPVYLPDVNLPWWGHTALVVPTTFICVVLIVKLRLLRPLRRIVTVIVVVLLILGAPALLDFWPRAY